MRRLLDYAGLEPEDAVLRWGNFDRIFLLPSTVFQARRHRPIVSDAAERPLRSGSAGVALPRGLDGFFLVPDRPELREVVAGTGGGDRRPARSRRRTPGAAAAPSPTSTPRFAA